VADPYFELALRAADLRERLPQEFERLVEQVRVIEAKAVRAMVAAAPDGVLAAQAEVRVVEKIREKLEDCIAIKRQAESKRG